MVCSFMASYGFMKAYDELRKGMKDDGLIKEKTNEKVKC